MGSALPGNKLYFMCQLILEGSVGITLSIKHGSYVLRQVIANQSVIFGVIVSPPFAFKHPK